MTFSVLKITSALVAIACAVQAAPTMKRHCVGSECNQSASSGNVNLGSTTNIVPVTQVIPITRYQPIVQAYRPIVESECDQSLGDMGYMKPYGYGAPYYQGSMYGSMYGSMPGGPAMDVTHGSYGLGPKNYRMGYVGSNPRGMFKRDATVKSQEESQNEKHHVLNPECVPSATETCQQSLPMSSTDMGSYVTARPKDVILSSTVYQGHVQDKAADIYAAPAQHSTLSHSSVDLGSNTFIQPVTKVLPETTYQPSVDQKATTIEAAAPENLSLARSSVSLGSSVQIRPTTTVEPLTLFQPSIQSLPFEISDEGCN